MFQELGCCSEKVLTATSLQEGIQVACAQSMAKEERTFNKTILQMSTTFSTYVKTSEEMEAITIIWSYFLNLHRNENYTDTQTNRENSNDQTE